MVNAGKQEMFRRRFGVHAEGGPWGGCGRWAEAETLLQGEIRSWATEEIGSGVEARDEWRCPWGAREHARFLTENTARARCVSVSLATCRGRDR